jgi:ABC-type nitrate/sulfonate/bicarbonate transport system substrate-binding protein
MRARRTVVACLLASLAILPGCGERKEPRAPKSMTVVRVALPALNTGLNSLLAAKGAGYFEQAGLDVVPHVSVDGAAAIEQVQQGKAGLAVATEPDLLEARGRGGRVVSVATIVQRPLTSLIGPKLNLGSIVGLATKPIGTQGLDYQQAFAETIFKRARVVKVGANPIPALKSKKVSAAIAPVGAGRLPAGINSTPVDKLKVPSFSEYVLVANEDALTRDDDMIRSFAGALARGTRNLGAARKVPFALPLRGVDAARMRASMLPPAGKPYGWHDAAAWRRFAGWMRAHRLPQKLPGAFTNDLLPGQGP